MMLEKKRAVLLIMAYFSTLTLTAGRSCAYFAFLYPTLTGQTLTVEENTIVNFSFTLRKENCANSTHSVIEISHLNPTVGVYTTQCQILLKDKQCHVDELYSKICSCDSPKGPYRFAKVFSGSDSTQWVWSTKENYAYQTINVNVTRSTPVTVEMRTYGSTKDASWDIFASAMLFLGVIIAISTTSIAVVVLYRQEQKLRSAICVRCCKLQCHLLECGNDDNQAHTSNVNNIPLDVGSGPDQVDARSVNRGTDIQSFYCTSVFNSNVDRVPARRTTSNALQTRFTNFNATENPLRRGHSPRTHEGQQFYSRLQRASRLVHHLYDRFSRYRSSRSGSVLHPTGSSTPPSSLITGVMHPTGSSTPPSPLITGVMHPTGSSTPPSPLIMRALPRGSNVSNCSVSSSTYDYDDAYVIRR